MREQISKYRRIFELTEDKIVMISNAFRQYLNMREQELLNASGDSRNTSSTSSRRNGSLPSGGIQKTRAPRKKSLGKGADGGSAVPAIEPQVAEQASTNTSDIDLLESKTNLVIYLYFCFGNF